MTAGKNGKSETSREQRLKAALKANLARRKAQAKARDDGSDSAATKDRAAKHEDNGHG